MSSNLPDAYSLSNTCKNLNFNPQYQCKFIDSNGHTIYFYDEILDQIISNFIAPKFYNVPEKVDLLCSYMYFSVKLREPIKFEQSIKDFIHSKDVVPISELFSLKEEFNISILTTISNVVAGPHPELALYILKEELSMFNFNNTDYAIKDFMLNPSEELKGNEYLAQDFVPEMCLN
ncbi:hypothetical protein [Candidatus Aquarickettsia rohweri]|uniref:Uncharacterized protein n=1 Tax=Candidatus Aquarickettsia rohweri TaxID=2602574 RepID=A0A429XUR3_9RICK|nr:hypothetical protein [Candidatus Aquarickettsia rohweri]RST71894.1 hypothetical protein EIC27_00670 [Candidatus Aquarickettsia rohweri]